MQLAIPIFGPGSDSSFIVGFDTETDQQLSIYHSRRNNLSSAGDVTAGSTALVLLPRMIPAAVCVSSPQSARREGDRGHDSTPMQSSSVPGSPPEWSDGAVTRGGDVSPPLAPAETAPEAKGANGSSKRHQGGNLAVHQASRKLCRHAFVPVDTSSPEADMHPRTHPSAAECPRPL